MTKHFQKSGFTLLVAVLLMFSDEVFSQVRIYLNTDLEGISGVYKFSQTREKDTPLNIQACEYFMDDVAAVVRGLIDGGADDIVVLDGHGSQVVIPHLMEPGATYITGRPRPGAGNLSLLDSTFSAMVMIGFHAMMGTPDGVLNHTQSSKTENRYWYNGVESGELAQNAIIAGYYGIPVIMVSGDVATCREAVKFFGSEIVTVPVKKGLSREAAVLYPFDVTRQALYDGAIKAMGIISKCKPYKIEFPANVRMQYINSEAGRSEPEIITVEGIARDALHILDFEKE